MVCAVGVFSGMISTVATYHVSIDWDDDAQVWVATSPDIEGLALEAGSYDLLVNRVQFAVPELLELNHQPAGTVRLRFISERELVAA